MLKRNDDRIDSAVLRDARRMVESAARLLRRLELEQNDKLLSHAIANLHAALARLA